MHPHLAYHLKGIPYWEDHCIINRYEKEYRDIFKSVVLVGFNAKDQHSAIIAISDKLQKEGLVNVNQKETKRLLIDFKNKHCEIDDFITYYFGVKAMYYDSNIITDCLSELMIKRGIFPFNGTWLNIVRKKKYWWSKKTDGNNLQEDTEKKALVERKVIEKEQSLPDELQAIVDVEWENS